METMDLPVEAPAAEAPTTKRKKRSDEGQMLIRKISRLKKNRERLRRIADSATKRFQKADEALSAIQAACAVPAEGVVQSPTADDE